MSAVKVLNLNNMKKFIKGNWFKLGILIIMLVAGIFYITNYKSSDMEIVILKEKCLKDAKEFISKSSSARYVENPIYPITQYDSVYSPELKTCLVDISRNTSPQHWYYAIIDIYTEKEIASYALDKTDKESLASQILTEDYKKYEAMKNKYFSE